MTVQNWFEKKATNNGWYRWLENKLAPTEGIANLVLILLILVTVYILLQHSKVLKAAWIAYWVSP